MSFVCRGIAILAVSGGCASQLARPSVPYGGHTLHFATATIGAAAASGAPGETPAVATGDLSLAEAYKLALRRSDTVALAELGVGDAELSLRETSTEIRPSVTVSGKITAQSNGLLGKRTPQPNRFTTGAIDVAQPLFRRGYFSARDAGRYGIESAELMAVRAREELSRDVVRVYIASVRARKLRDLAVAQVERTKATVDYLTQLKKAGAALRSAELLAQLDLKRAQRGVVDAEREVGVADATFRRVVGVMPPAQLDLPEVPELPADAAGQELVKGRKDIKALDLEVQASHADEVAAAGQRWWPRLDLVANAQAGYLIGFDDDTTLNGETGLTWSVSGVLTIPIYQKGVDTVHLERAQNQTRIAERTRELQAKIATEEAQAAAAQVAGTEQALAIAEKELAGAQEHYKLITLQYKAGAITFLEVTNSQSVLTEAENASVRAKIDRVSAAYDYLAAIGALDLAKAK